MNRAVIFCGLVALASGLAWADAIVLSSGESLVNMPASISNPGPGTNCGVTGNASGNCGTLGTGPYWDNLSGDGNQLNGGYFLTGTGGFGGGTNYMPGQYLSQSNGSGQADQPTDITLDHTTSAATATLLLNDTNNTDDVFGYYNTGTMAETALFGPGSLSGDIGGSNNLTNLLNSEDYGFYLTRCLVYVSGFSGACSQYTTWFSNDALDTTDAGHQHFAIFTSPTTGIYYLAISDWLMGNSGEGLGDYNDLVFELNTDPTIPEPGTFGLVAAGLLSLGLARFWTRKKRGEARYAAALAADFAAARAAS